MLRRVPWRLLISLVFPLSACSGGVNDPPARFDQADSQALHDDAAAGLSRIDGGLALLSSLIDRSSLADRLGVSAGELDVDAPLWADALVHPDDIVDQDFSSLRYRANPARICAALQLDQLEGASCAAVFSRAPITTIARRLRIGHIDLDVLIGASQSPLIEASIGPDTVSIQIRLEEIAPALSAFGIDRGFLPEILAGTFAVTINASDTLASLAVDVRRAISLENRDGSFSLSLPARDRIVAIDLDDSASRVFATLDLGEISSRAPLELITSLLPCETCVAPMTGSLGIHLAAVTHRLDLQVASERLRVESDGLGAGILRLDFDGAPILSLDANVGISKSLEVLARISGSSLDLAVTPALALGVDLTLAPLDTRIGGLPAWAKAEHLSIQLDHADEARVLLPFERMTRVEPITGLPPPLMPERVAQVAAGLLSLDSAAIGRSIRVAAGECLLRDPPGDTAEHPFALLRNAACE